MQIYLVGGAVRDKLLGITSKDKDWVVVGGSVEDMKAQGFKPIGKDFPVFLHPQTKEEYALARSEKKTGRGHKNFSFITSKEISLDDDLSRRDLTINAIAENQSGELIDPFNGRLDIERRILRHVSPAFVEDPLRVLRVARFAARFGFHIAAETLVLMQEIVNSGELTAMAPERIWGELEKAMGEPYPVHFILALRACNALNVLFPEIDCLFGVPQTAQFHPEIDTGLHVLMSLRQATKLSTDPQIRFAVLLHDLGKGTTHKEKLPKHHGHEERGVELIEQLCQRYRAPKKYRELAVQVSRYHLMCHRVRELRADTILRKLESMDAFRKAVRFKKFLLCCEADARGRSGFGERVYPQASFFSRMLYLANNIYISDLREAGLMGKSMADAIRIRRLEAIKSALANI